MYFNSKIFNNLSILLFSFQVSRSLMKSEFFVYPAFLIRQLCLEIRQKIKFK